ncbi:VQ motif-containing protein 20-like [Morus notabilis]|uniref:VQ motif-containing protein 20-like n=1 Tax=Morus notabilis TaxID=981085 RepID=UPI000CECF5EB|nr:VQ motif-containing protein 20-like [Morus notabilis]
MSPSQLHSNKDVQSYWASPLKINKASHTIKKPSSSPSSSSSSSTLAIILPPPPLPQQCNPVIIYTHSPKVITTNPRDFMTLVQKLTGISSSKDNDDDDDDTNPPWTQPETGDASSPPLSEINKGSKTAATGNDDNESSSVTTEENGSCSNVGDHIGQENSCSIKIFHRY